MEVFVTGGSGFVGRSLCRRLAAEGCGVTVLTRSTEAAARLSKRLSCCLGDPTRPGPWQDQAAGADVFINLAGASIFKRWNRKTKELIESSRVETTKNLVQAMARRKDQSPAVLISASAVGYYGFRGDKELLESSPPGEDFLARVCRRWEDQAFSAKELGARVAVCRFGVVLGTGGGALSRLESIFRLGLGGRLGSGRQWFSWVHQKDLVDILATCLFNPEYNGPVNATSPHPVTNRELTRALGRVLKKPALLPAPGFAVKAALGEFADVLLKGQKVIPKALLERGFNYEFPELEPALVDLLTFRKRRRPSD